MLYPYGVYVYQQFQLNVFCVVIYADISTECLSV